MANPTAITLHASGAETTSGESAAVDIGAGRSCVSLELVITAVAGATRSFLFTLQTAPTTSGPWRSVTPALGPYNDVTKQEKSYAGLDRYVKAIWAISGSGGPSFTFSISGTAHQLYCSPSDLSKTAVNATALSNIDASVQAECCLRATDDCESALNSSFSLPITAWGNDLRGHVAARAVYYAMCHRGFNPESAGDQLILMNGGHVTADGRKSGAQMFFDAIRDGKLKPVGIVDQTPDTYEGAGFVISDAARA